LRRGLPRGADAMTWLVVGAALALAIVIALAFIRGGPR
jgi:hypothetical protein